MSSSWPGSASLPSARPAAPRARPAAAGPPRARGRRRGRRGREQQGLAGVDPLAAAEHGGDPFLGAQILLAPAPARGAAGPDVDLARDGEAAVGDLLAARRSRSAPRPPAPAQLVAGVGGGDGVHVRARLSRPIPSATSASAVSSASVASSSQRGGLLVARKGAKARTAVARVSGRGRARLGLGLARPAPAPAGGGGAPSVCTHQHALVLRPRAGQIATVRQRQRAGEIELRESE